MTDPQVDDPWRSAALEAAAARLFVAHGHPGEFCGQNCPTGEVDACVCGSAYQCRPHRTRGTVASGEEAQSAQRPHTDEACAYVGYGMNDFPRDEHCTCGDRG